MSGVGQHYNMAAYIGLKFSQEKDSEEIRPRDKKLEVLIIPKFLKINSSGVSIQNIKLEIEKCIMPLPASDLFSGTFIDKEIEVKEGFCKVEFDFFNKYKDCTGNIIKDENSMGFFALHEARSFENFFSLRNDIIEVAKKTKGFNGFYKNLTKENLLLKNLNTHKQKLMAKTILLNFYTLYHINPRPKKQVLNKEVEFLFNYLYPLYQKKLKYQYLNLEWRLIKSTDDLNIGIGDGFVIDINKEFYWDMLNHDIIEDKDFKLFIKNTIIVIVDKKTLFIGFEKKQIKYLEKLENSIENKFNNDGKLFAELLVFLTFLNFVRSVNYIVITNKDFKDNLLDRFSKSIDFYQKLLSEYKVFQQNFK